MAATFPGNAVITWENQCWSHFFIFCQNFDPNLLLYLENHVNPGYWSTQNLIQKLLSPCWPGISSYCGLSIRFSARFLVCPAETARRFKGPEGFWPLLGFAIYGVVFQDLEFFMLTW